MVKRKKELEVWLNQPDSRMLEGFEYLTGWDTLQKLRDHSVDCVYSVRVLEHVPIGQIKELMAEIHRVTRINGLGFHLIDHSFHGTHGKRTGISVEHLTYSARWWSLFHSRKLYHENRLRACDYRQYFTGAGFDIRYFREWVNSDSLEAIRQKKLILAPEFRHYSIKDLCVDQSLWLVRRMGHVDSIEG